MHINLLEVIETDGKELQGRYPFEMEKIMVNRSEFTVLHSEMEELPVSLHIVNTGRKVLDLSGHCTIVVMIPCDRCLDEVAVPISLDFRYALDMKLSSEERVAGLDECAYLSGVDLDVDTLVYLEALMNWPSKVLCREDCPGLCPVCGKRLADGPCGCEREPVDPRMAAISDLFRKFKEV